MPAWVDAGFDDYARRMPRESALRLDEVKPEARGERGDDPAQVQRVLEAEARRITAAISRNAYKVVLDERGHLLSTADVAQRLRDWQMGGRDIAFVIGGADGIAESLKTGADLVWSLSRLTLPHALVRVIVAEQLYRAMMILKNHPYHRA